MNWENRTAGFGLLLALATVGLEAPADRLLRNAGARSSYLVLPLFALANAGVALRIDTFGGRERRYLYAELGDRLQETSRASVNPLWPESSKLLGRYLAPYLEKLDEAGSRPTAPKGGLQ